MTDINWNTCAFADEGCTCGRPSLAMVEQTELEKLRAKVDELTAAQDRAAKRIDGLRDYILGALDEDDTLAPDEMRNASIDLADALADLGHPVADEDEAPRRSVVTVELPAKAVTR